MAHASADKPLPRYNFGPAWKHDACIFGAERPGFVRPRRDQPSTPRGPDVTDECVQEWIQYMLDNKVRHVLCLLTREELRFYSSSYIRSLEAHFDTVTNVDFTTDWSLAILLGCLSRASSKNERIVVHCTTGQTRTANVLALWLHKRHNQTIEDAVAHVVQTALQSNTMRRPTPDGVVRLLMNTPSMPVSARLTRPLSARTSSQADICFIQMGGRIDATVAATDNQAFDIGEAAISRILTQAGCTSAVDILPLCRKHGHDILPADHESLASAIKQTEATLVIITIGLQALWQTAEYLRAKSQVSTKKTVILTGSRVPAAMIASDAAFNIGCAVGAIRFLSPGVYTCVEGRVCSIQDSDLTANMRGMSLDTVGKKA